MVSYPNYHAMLFTLAKHLTASIPSHVLTLVLNLDGKYCMSARRAHAECQDGYIKPTDGFTALEEACLCAKNKPKPYDLEWQNQLFNCVQCIENATAGKHDISYIIGQTKPTSYYGICKNSLPFDLSRVENF